MPDPTLPGLFEPSGEDRSLRLERPLVVFDLETTGTDPERDRIVEIAACRLEPDGGRRWLVKRIDPGVPIPPEASAVHGITDADVAGKPRFAEAAGEIAAFFEEADVAGFNIVGFDVPALDAEFRRAGRSDRLADRRWVDAMTIFHRKERRDLSAAVRLYLGREHEDAHAARADVEATVEILEQQVRRYDDLPVSVEGLDAWCRAPPPGALDPSRRLVWRGQEAVVNFGPHRNRPLREVAADPDGRGFLRWILAKDFDDAVKAIVRDALDGRFPSPPNGGED